MNWRTLSEEEKREIESTITPISRVHKASFLRTTFYDTEERGRHKGMVRRESVDKL